MTDRTSLAIRRPTRPSTSSSARARRGDRAAPGRRPASQDIVDLPKRDDLQSTRHGLQIAPSTSGSGRLRRRSASGSWNCDSDHFGELALVERAGRDQDLAQAHTGLRLREQRFFELLPRDRLALDDQVTPVAVVPSVLRRAPSDRARPLALAPLLDEPLLDEPLVAGGASSTEVAGDGLRAAARLVGAAATTAPHRHRRAPSRHVERRTTLTLLPPGCPEPRATCPARHSKCPPFVGAPQVLRSP